MAGAAGALEAALGIYRDLSDRLGEAHALYHLGIGLRQTGDYLGATQMLEAALGIYRDLGNREGEANALNEVGAVRRQTGDYPGAAGALEAALGICRGLGDRGGEVEALNELGTLHRVRGDVDKAGLLTCRPWTWPARSAAPGMRLMRWPAWAAAPWPLGVPPTRWLACGRRRRSSGGSARPRPPT